MLSRRDHHRWSGGVGQNEKAAAICTSVVYCAWLAFGCDGLPLFKESELMDEVDDILFLSEPELDNQDDIDNKPSTVRFALSLRLDHSQDT